MLEVLSLRSGVSIRNSGDHSRAADQGAVHRTLISNLDQLIGHCRIDVARHTDNAFEAVDLARATLGNLAAVLAMLSWKLAMLHLHGKRANGDLLVIGIEP